jgi:alkanesulfonate monooxygenase SsuD/methylene tetrahydromethanopterin reductase-like flavin-dependent oxidoreductase (luciferase family)
MVTATERIRLGPMVTPLARRRPVKVARETAAPIRPRRRKIV